MWCLLGLLRGLPIPDPRRRNMWGPIWGDLRRLDGTEMLTSSDLFDWIDFMSGLSTFWLVGSKCSISPREETLNLESFARPLLHVAVNLSPLPQLLSGFLRRDEWNPKDIHVEHWARRCARGMSRPLWPRPQSSSRLFPEPRLGEPCALSGSEGALVDKVRMIPYIQRIRRLG